MTNPYPVMLSLSKHGLDERERIEGRLYETKELRTDLVCECGFGGGEDEREFAVAAGF